MPPVAPLPPLPPATPMRTPGSYKLTLNKKEKKKRRLEREKEKKRKRERREKEKEKEKKKGKKKGRPRTGKKGSSRKNYRTGYCPEDIEKAVGLVQNENYSVARAAKEWGVPRVTLMDRLRGTHKTGAVGRPTVLYPAEEKGLVNTLVQMGRFGYPVTRRYLMEIVKDYLDKTRKSG